MLKSTSLNVRPMLSRLRLGLIHACLKAAEIVAPSAGAAVVERLWFTLPTPTADARRYRTGLPEEVTFTADVGGRAVRGSSWGTGEAVYLVHGWGGWANQLEALVPPLLAAGLKVVTFDAPSHGASDAGRDGPRSTAVPEMVDSLRAVVEMNGPARAIVAHSLGAMATAAALRDGLTADRVVFLSPFDAFGSGADHFGAMLGFGPRVRERLMDRVERRIHIRCNQPLAHFEVPAIGRVLASQGRDPDLLIVHDRDDPETPFEGAVAISETWPRSTLLAVEGLGHSRLLRDEAVMANVVGFLAPAIDDVWPTSADQTRVRR